MEYLEKLRRLPQKELKAELEKNKYRIKGSYVIHKSIVDGEKHLPEQILYRNNEYIYTLHNKRIVEKPLFEVKPFGMDEYKQVLKVHFLNGSGITNINSVFKMYTKDIYTMFGEENIDIDIQNNSIAALKIRYPELTVRNSHDFTRTLQDVYVTHMFNLQKGKLSMSTYVFRAKATVGEVRTGYFLSHISGSPGKISSQFCFGNNPLETIYKVRGYIQITDLLHYLQQFTEFLQWESIEGGPYRFMHNIKDYAIQDSESVFGTELPAQDALGILQLLEGFTYTYRSDGYRDFIEEIDIKKALKQYFINIGKTDSLGISIDNGLGISIDNSFGIPIEHPVTTAEDLGIMPSTYTFKGTTVPFEITPYQYSDVVTPTIENLEPNPNDVYLVQKFIERRFQQALTNHLLNKYD